MAAADGRGLEIELAGGIAAMPRLGSSNGANDKSQPVALLDGAGSDSFVRLAKMPAKMRNPLG